MSDNQLTRLTQATIRWQDNGHPFSTQFDDIYFSPHAAIDESCHVFIKPNHLPERWAALPTQQQHFTIAETGFGTGLNFLIAADLWLNSSASGGNRQRTLHYISVEKHPLAKSDIERIVEHWPQFKHLTKPLLQQYPPAIGGMHRLKIHPQVTLTLLYGDAEHILKSLCHTDHPSCIHQQPARVDTWFLDGFAPAKNPAMWSDDLFSTMQTLSHASSTFSTFTAAGIVRRGLQQVGFTVKKIAGFGNKREMLCGTFDPTQEISSHSGDGSIRQPFSRKKPPQPPWYIPPAQQLPRPVGLSTEKSCTDASLTKAPSAKTSVVVIGGGIAGCATARAMAERGFSVTLIEQHNQLANEASGNPQAILYPKLSHQPSTLIDFGLSALLHSARFFHRINCEHNPPKGTHDLACGVMVLPTTTTEQQQFAVIAQHYPNSFIQLLNNQQQQSISGIATASEVALLFPQLGWLNPAAMCQQLVSHPHITLVQGHVDALVCEHENTAEQTAQWHLLDTSGNNIVTAPYVVVCCGYSSSRFTQTQHLPLKKIRGQITSVPATPQTTPLKTVICGKGYMAPASHMVLGISDTGGNPEELRHTLGATYDIGDKDTTVRAESHQRNFQQWQDTDTRIGEMLGASTMTNLTGRVSFRCTTPDYLPIAGQAPVADSLICTYQALRKNALSDIPQMADYWPGLFINTGHGSKGMSFAPYCAEYIASSIARELPPLSLAFRQAIHPGRFIIRDLKRNRC